MESKKKNIIFLIIGILGFILWAFSLFFFVLFLISENRNTTLFTIITVFLFLGAFLDAIAIGYFIYRFVQASKIKSHV